LALEIVENQEENSSLALEFFENMNEPNACGCLTICACVCTAPTHFLTPSKLVGFQQTPIFLLRDDEMKVLPELPKLHEAADMMQVFRKDSPFNLILARELALALNVLVAPAFSVATHVHVLGIGSRTSAWRQNPSRKVFAKRNAKALKFEL
jgi:hypothetical protein